MTDIKKITEDGNIPTEYRQVQQTLDSFVEVNYRTALDAVCRYGDKLDIGYLKRQVLDILADNPPMATVPMYYADDNCVNYLWYSDLYDDMSKECFKEYGKGTLSVLEITPANYAEELSAVNLPYFKELVKLISLIRQIKYFEENSVDTEQSPADEEYKKAFSPKEYKVGALPSPTRSYEPNMNEEQYALLAECIDTLELFKESVTAEQLRELLSGRQPRLFRITNQKKFTYLFDELAKHGYIRKNWISVAGYNCDFASVQPQWMIRKHGNRLHHITSQQFTNCRRLNKSQAIEGVNTIDETIEKMSAL